MAEPLKLSAVVGRPTVESPLLRSAGTRSTRIPRVTRARLWLAGKISPSLPIGVAWTINATPRGKLIVRPSPATRRPGWLDRWLEQPWDRW